VAAAARDYMGSHGKGKTVIRVNGGIFYARTPGLELAGTRTTNGSVGQNIYRDSTFNGFGLTPPAYTAWSPMRDRPRQTIRRYLSSIRITTTHALIPGPPR